MRYLLFILYFICVSIYPALGVNKAETKIFDERYASLQIRVNDNWRNPPVIRLNSDDVLSVEFDVLVTDLPQLYFTITHCNADWSTSLIPESEYLNGFNRMNIDNCESSYNTLTSYVHYSVLLPNDLLCPLISGNYVLNVYDYDSESGIPALSACFFVTEERVEVAGSVSGITLDDYKDKHQQLKISLKNDGFRVSNPQSEIRIIIQQNGRRDNQKQITNPLYMNNSEIVYANSKDLIFEAGNQFHRFEMITHQYAGMGIEHIDYKYNRYNVFLYEDKVTADKSYKYERDEYGKYIVRALDASDNQTEADYYLTHFKLNYDNPFLEGSIYIFGELSEYRFKESCRMQYDPELKAYRQSLLLKEGLYNYMYLYVPMNSEKGSTSLIEGNYYETRNEYLVLVYYKSIGDRYDRLIATTLLY